MQIITKIGKIEEDDSDVLINWGYINLKTGPYPFDNIIKQANTQVYYMLMLYNEYLNYCDCISTIQGQLRVNLIIHSIVPDYPNKYNNNFSNIKNTLETYKNEDNLVRTISTYIPDYQSVDLFMQYLYTYLPEINTLRVVTIYCNEQQQQQEIESYIKKENNKENISLFNKLLNYLK